MNELSILIQMLSKYHARLASEVTALRLELRQMNVYDVAELGERFDIVLFLSVLDHLRHPLLALDLLNEHVAKDLLIFESLMRGSEAALQLQPDYPCSKIKLFNQEGFPLLHFIDQKYCEDPTKWWIPSRPCVEAMLPRSGFEINDRPEGETYICRRVGTHG